MMEHSSIRVVAVLWRGPDSIDEAALRDLCSTRRPGKSIGRVRPRESSRVVGR